MKITFNCFKSFAFIQQLKQLAFPLTFVKKMWEATKYLSAPYELWVANWKEVGSPDLDDFFLK
jgi:hypothetical protein